MRSFLFAKNPWRFTSKKAILQVTWRLGRPETSWHGDGLKGTDIMEHVVVASPLTIFFYKMGSSWTGGTSFLFQTCWGPVVSCQEIWFEKADLKDLYLSSKLTPLMCLLAKTWNLDPKLWLWEFKQKSFIKENLHFFFEIGLNSNYINIQECVVCLGRDSRTMKDTHFWSGKIGFPIPILDPSWMDVSCGVLGPGFRWISRIHWTSSPSSTGATRLFGGLRLTPKKKNAKKRRWRLVIIIIYHIYNYIYIYWPQDFVRYVRLTKQMQYMIQSILN